ncbi:alpha-mannosidase [Alkalibacterium putridalgicola]|uniref:Alpha-mannosidase n=1 Tax=Alkalibacterium putridalgicola TaxID=426703 RepID=A0A1H7TEM2_9LACT|nr:glycosyl hydrolase-related protein [Alkalibacterium putridalgicola]GEK89437.1 alpha-mannosidase [Alkalibacterium putridalgicola]SEL83138.1 alpha-mannosidase [Alkalibacterium putridalgicola]
MTSKRVYIVPHSHWDREWYFTIEDSNLILVENINRLLDVLEQDTAYHGYVFDGQLSVVEEFLRIEPKQTDRLKKLIEKKRLFIGPWYTQADSLLTHKESLVRNLLYGVSGSEKMGHSMNVGYLPDIFGQNTYLPSLFKNFGIDYGIFQRGLYTDELNGDVHFKWQSPDGESVKGAVLPLGYGPGKFLEASKDYMNDHLKPLVDKVSDMSKHTDHILFPSGGDQVLVREHFPETVRALNAMDGENSYVLSDYETYMDETWNEEAFNNTIEGELIATETSRMHRTIRSQRYDIKYWNYQVEHKLIGQLEPLAVMGHALGLRYPKARLDEMWKELFDVHAHDSIGGCNSDATNQNIMERLHKIDRQIDGLMNIIKRQMTQAIVNQSEEEQLLVVFNTNGKAAKQNVEAILFTDQPSFELISNEGETLSYSLLEQIEMDGGKKIQVTDEGEKEVPLPGYFKTKVLIESLSLPSFGYTTLNINAEVKPNQDHETTPVQSLENDQVKIFVEDGSLFLYNKVSDKTLKDFLQFEDTADAGDSYDYSPLPGSEPILIDQFECVTTSQSGRVQLMDLETKAQLPKLLDERRQADHNKQQASTENITIKTRLTLKPDDVFVHVHHEIENTVKDHRLRVLIQTPVEKPLYSYGDQGYSLIQRPLVEERMADWKERGYKEAPVPIYTVERFAGLKGEKTAITAFTKGIKEYEVLKDTRRFALTLFRSVGLLGRDDLAWRPGRASGINNKVVKTPDAQMLGAMTFDYAVCFGNDSDKVLFDLADQYNSQVFTYQHQKLNTFEERLDRFEIPYPISKLQKSQSLLELSDPKVFISALKHAEEGTGAVVRLYNPTDQEVKLSIKTSLGETIFTTDLKEEKQAEVSQITVPSRGYQTVLIEKEGTDPSE